MKPTFASDPPKSRSPEPWGRTAPEADEPGKDNPNEDNPNEDNKWAQSGRSAQYFDVPLLYAPPTDSVDEAEARFQEHVARRGLEELVERGELELLGS